MHQRESAGKQLCCVPDGEQTFHGGQHDSVKKVAAGLDKKGHQGFCFDVAAIEKIEDFIKMW